MTPREIARMLLQLRKACPAQPVKLTPVPMNEEAVRRVSAVMDALPPREIVTEFESRVNGGDLWLLREMRIKV